MESNPDPTQSCSLLPYGFHDASPPTGTTCTFPAPPGAIPQERLAVPPVDGAAPMFLQPGTNPTMMNPGVAPPAITSQDGQGPAAYFQQLFKLYYSQHFMPRLGGQQRVALPDSKDSPIYVNAKQYHCILRRRQQRAKAERENKIVKTRKAYLHESRHVHATRRVRGAGGRFLPSSSKNKKASESEQSVQESSSTATSGRGGGGLPSTVNEENEKIDLDQDRIDLDCTEMRIDPNVEGKEVKVEGKGEE
ncbi:hypothetical protein BSKO_01414 [Bryopsis sp. KO-2023]|nr:hypothetical protein BSKO_01414 [Bryopsis sp. KO-2023]